MADSPSPHGREVLVRIERCGVCHFDLPLQDGHFSLGADKELDVSTAYAALRRHTLRPERGPVLLIVLGGVGMMGTRDSARAIRDPASYMSDLRSRVQRHACRGKIRDARGALTCTKCGGPLHARDGRFMLEYFLVGGSGYPLRPRSE